MALLDIRPLQDGLPFGIRIGGLTLQQLDDAAIRNDIDDLFIQHGMIVFEGVEQTDAMQLAISNCSVPLEVHSVKVLTRACSYHHKWREGDMVIWDNLRMLHCLSGYRPDDTRPMYPTTVKGDYGHGRWERPERATAAADAMA